MDKEGVNELNTKGTEIIEKLRGELAELELAELKRKRER